MIPKRTNEQAIEHYGPQVLSVYYYLRTRVPNGIIYPDREQAATKLGVNRSTLSRWIAQLVSKGLAVKRGTGHVVLSTIEQLIRSANNGALPFHKCTLIIGPTDTRQEIQEQLELKLLERKHRQVLFAVSETKIDHKLLQEYGVIHNPKIKQEKRKSVKSRMKQYEQETGAPMSAKSIAEELGISERKWFRLSKRMKQRGWINSIKQEQELGIWMSQWQYLQARDHFGFATKRSKKGWITRVLPNRLFMTIRYDLPSSLSLSSFSSSSPDGYTLTYCGGQLLAMSNSNKTRWTQSERPL